MRYLYVLLCTVLAFTLSSQTPPFINYQGVARNATGAPFVNKTIGLKFDIRQGSATGQVVFTETQSVSTGNLGLFSVRIGTTTANGVGIVNWNDGNFFLEVSLDTANTQNYTSLGTQQIISVPYAMQAASVPATYTNQVLSIGNQTMSIDNQNLSLSAPNTLSITNGNTVEIAPTLDYTNNVLTVGPTNNTVTIPIPAPSTFTGIGAATVTSTGSLYQINVPKANITPSTNINVSGTFPDFTVSATPTLSLLGPNTLSISGGNSVGLAPTIALNGNSLSVGSPTNYVAIPTPSLVGTGAASINPPIGLTYVIHVPPSNLTPAGGGITITNGGINQATLTVPATTLVNGTNVNVTGSNSYFVINATPTLNLLSPNTLSISGGNTVTLAPTLSFTNNVLTVGPSTNVVTIPSPSTSITSSGVVNVTSSSGSNFTVHVPNPVLSTTGQSIAITQGTANSSVLVPSPTLAIANNTLTVGTNSIALETYTVAGPGLNMTPGPNHTITSTIVSPTFASVGAVSVTPSSGSNITVTVPQTTVTTTAGIANVTSAGTNSFNVNVPSPTINVAGNVITVTQGTATASATIPPPALTMLGANNNSLTAGGNTVALNTYTVAGPGIQMNGAGPDYTITNTYVNPTITSSGAANVTPSTGSLINVHVPLTSVTATSGIASVNPAGTNSFNVNVPPPAISVTGSVITVTQGTATTSASIQPPTLTKLGANSNSITAGGNTIALNTYTVAGPGLQMTGAGPDYTISSTHVNPTITGTGMALVTSTAGTTFVVDVSPGYTPATGVLGGGTHTVNITPTVSFSNKILSVGPSSNSVDISGVSPWTQSATAVVLTNTNSNVGIGTNAPAENLQVESSSGGARLSIISPSPQTSSLLFGRPGAHNLGRLEYSTGGNTMELFSNNNMGIHIDANGNVGINNNFPSPHDLSVFNSGNKASIRISNTVSPSFGLEISESSTVASIMQHEPLPMYFGTSGVDRIAIDPSGNLGIGTLTPVSKLHIDMPNAVFKISNYPAGTGAILNTLLVGEYQGKGILAPQQRFQIQSSAGFMDIGQNAAGDFVVEGTDVTRLTVMNSGNVGVGTAVPTDHFQVETTGSTDMSIVSGSLSTLYFGNSSNHFLGAIRYNNANASMNFWTNNTPNRITINNAGNVGIGTANPGFNPGASKYLSVSSTTVYSNAPAAIEMEGALMGTGSPFARLDFNSWGPSATTSTNVARIGGYNGGTVGQGVLGFSTRNGSTMIERMRIDEAGKVSIGNFAQTASLQVVDGNQAAGRVLTSDALGNAKWMEVLPAGVVMAYAGATIPSGWLLCDGAQYPKTTYPNLFAAIGTAWGIPTSTTDFYVPDMRGMFLRGVTGSSANDPDAITRSASRVNGNTGNQVGSLQQDQFESHTHGIGSATTLLGGVITVGANGPGSNPIGNTGGQETRPKNVYVYYIIKY